MGAKTAISILKTGKLQFRLMKEVLSQKSWRMKWRQIRTQFGLRSQVGVYFSWWSSSKTIPRFSNWEKHIGEQCRCGVSLAWPPSRGLKIANWNNDQKRYQWAGADASEEPKSLFSLALRHPFASWSQRLGAFNGKLGRADTRSPFIFLSVCCGWC